MCAEQQGGAAYRYLQEMEQYKKLSCDTTGGDRPMVK